MRYFEAILSLTIAVLAFAPLCTQASSVKTKTIHGEAYEGEHFSAPWPKSLYTIDYVTQKGADVDQLTIIDKDEQGKAFYEQTVDLEAGVPKTFSFSNDLLDQQGSLTVTDKDFILTFTEKGKTKTVKKSRSQQPFAVGPSLNRLVAEHFDELVAGKDLSFRMVVIQRLDVYGMKISRERVDPKETIPQLKDGRWVKLVMKVDDPFIGIFAPKIYEIYDAKTGKLLFVKAPLASADIKQQKMTTGTVRYKVTQ